MSHARRVGRALPWVHAPDVERNAISTEALWTERSCGCQVRGSDSLPFSRLAETDSRGSSSTAGSFAHGRLRPHTRRLLRPVGDRHVDGGRRRIRCWPAGGSGFRWSGSGSSARTTDVGVSSGQRSTITVPDVAGSGRFRKHALWDEFARTVGIECSHRVVFRESRSSRPWLARRQSPSDTRAGWKPRLRHAQVKPDEANPARAMDTFSGPPRAIGDVVSSRLLSCQSLRRTRTRHSVRATSRCRSARAPKQRPYSALCPGL